MEKKIAIEILNNLPEAFNSLYWDMADTTYKQEVFIEMFRACKWDYETAIEIIKKSFAFPERMLLRKIIRGELVEIMGTYQEPN